MNICRGLNLINRYDKSFKWQDLERKLLLPERSPSIPRKASKESFKVQIFIISVYFRTMLKCFCLEQIVHAEVLVLQIFATVQY